MQSIKYENKAPEEVINLLESENCGIDEHYEFVKPYEDDQEQQMQREYIELSKELERAEQKKAELLTPILAELKELKKSTGEIRRNLTRGGELVTEKVYCFPDYDNNVMGLYDSRGALVGMRTMTRSERQLHINSHLHMKTK